MGNEVPQLIVADAAAWRTWLGGHHDDPAGVWLILAKKGTTEPTSLTYDQALDESLVTAGSMVTAGAVTSTPTSNALLHAGRAARGRDATWASLND